MFVKRLAFSVAGFLVLTACADSSPTADGPRMDEATVELVAESALDVNDQLGTPLPSLHSLLRRTFEAIRAQDGHAEGVRLLRAGHPLSAIVAVLGPEVVVEALAGVDQALARLSERFAGKVLPDRKQRILQGARNQAERGHAAMAEGRPAAALGAALASADLIRSLSPRFQARKAIERATRSYEAARTAVGDSPTEAEITALKKALRFRKAAVEAFQAKRYRMARTYALNSIALSQEVLQGRIGG